MSVEPADDFFFEDEDSALGAAEATHKALIDTQERMGMMLDIMPMGLLIHTEQGILFANQEACEMLQTGKEQFIGQHLLDFIAPDEALRAAAQFAESFKEGESVLKEETLLQRPDGTSVNINLISSRLPWAGTPVIQILLQDVTDLKTKEKTLQMLATTDELTGAFNRRHVFDEAAMLMDQSEGAENALSVVMIDVDHFKQINDTCGHAAGDRALIELSHLVARFIKEECGARAVFGRLGGEEFVLILPGVTERAAERAAEDLRSRVAAMRVPNEGGDVTFTISLGVAAYTRADRSFDSLLSRADEALYAAKTGGRNKVVAA